MRPVRLRCTVNDRKIYRKIYVRAQAEHEMASHGVAIRTAPMWQLSPMTQPRTSAL
jgi:hypothetical protein